jgi:hypothetical protein
MTREMGSSLATTLGALAPNLEVLDRQYARMESAETLRPILSALPHLRVLLLVGQRTRDARIQLSYKFASRCRCQFTSGK